MPTNEELKDKMSRYSDGSWKKKVKWFGERRKVIQITDLSKGSLYYLNFSVHLELYEIKNHKT